MIGPAAASLYLMFYTMKSFLSSMNSMKSTEDLDYFFIIYCAHPSRVSFQPLWSLVLWFLLNSSLWSLYDHIISDLTVLAYCQILLLFRGLPDTSLAVISAQHRFFNETECTSSSELTLYLPIHFTCCNINVHFRHTFYLHFSRQITWLLSYFCTIEYRLSSSLEL